MKKTIITGLLLGFGVLAFSQKSSKEIKGDKYFDLLNYSKAIDKYEKLDSSTISTDGLRKLAESYRLTFQTDDAERTYANLVKKSDVQPQDFYYYAYTLKENKKYLESNKWMDKFQATSSTNDLRVNSHKTGAANINALLVDNGQFTIKNLDLNSPQEDFGTSFYKDEVVFASSREGAKPVKRKWAGNDLPFLDVYKADRDLDNNELSDIKRFSKLTNKKYHEGPASFAKDGNFMAFTRNSYTGKSSDGTIKFQLFFSEKDEDGKWGEAKPFHKNSEEYSVGHPSLSADGNIMYFASDMPGGYGMADVYKVTRTSDGSWGEPANLGSEINTEGNDMFPFYHEGQELLFLASDGHSGLGGLDIFVSPDQGGFSKLQNLGVPINSNMDDFAFLADSELKSGYISSNREGGKGDDDLYSFSMLKPFMFGKKIEGIAKDKKGNTLSDVMVSLYENGKIVKTAKTDPNGKFSFLVDADKKFTLDGTKNKYFPGENAVSTKTDKDIVKTNLTLEKDPGVSMYLLVKDSKTGESLEGVKIRVVDNMSGKDFLNKSTGASGDMKKGLSGKKIGERLSYNITASKPGYFPKTVTFNHKIEKPGQIDVHSYLNGGLTLDKEVSDLADLIEINPIKFDLNKYNIRSDAALELNKIVGVMNKYPNMVVELGSHTDCRGSAKYNESLSDKRAKSSAEYIKTKITNPGNISGKGYGENRILNGCECEGSKRSTCNEDQHSENRRTEFKVISVGNDNVQVKNTSTDSFDK